MYALFDGEEQIGSSFPTEKEVWEAALRTSSGRSQWKPLAPHAFAKATKSIGASVHPYSGLPISFCRILPRRGYCFLNTMIFTSSLLATAIVSSAISIADPGADVGCRETLASIS